MDRMTEIYRQIAEFPERIKTLTEEGRRNRATSPEREVQHLLWSQDGACDSRRNLDGAVLLLHEVRARYKSDA